MNILDNVMTLQEAAQEWGIDDSTLRHAIKRKKFKDDEVKKSANTWLILKSGMIRLYGEDKKTIELFTIGYEGKTIESFVESLIDNKINYIFDVREYPISRKKGFSKSTLSSILKENGIQYVHFKELGSPKAIREKLHSSHDYKTFFNEYKVYLEKQAETMDIIKTSIFENKTLRFCLLCFEKESKYCHRSIIAKEIYDASSNRIKVIDI